MLVVFTNKSGGTVDMFEKAALDLIKLMGRRPAVPSAISKEDLPEALSQLQKELALIEEAEQNAEQDADDTDGVEDTDADEKPKPIGMAIRAFPLIELMQHSIKDDSFLMWDYR